ncbi:MAG: hypothetical protein CL927_08625 [Deltaproteobacteria bacterium]|nr:hypothetical protein [Deltaproteobacteria bacterium]HCH64794.1 hypothetical protein [Deltaproteobacteria bacterium]
MFAVILLSGMMLGQATEPQAAASPHSVQGTWTQQTPGPELQEHLDQAVGDVVSDLNIMIRELARRKLSGVTKVCGEYVLSVEPTVVRLGCDGGPVHVLPRDGQPYQTTNPAGQPVQGTVEVTDEAVILSWQGGAGKRVNHFERSEAGLRLSVTVSSENMPRPLKWQVDYGRSPDPR